MPHPVVLPGAVAVITAGASGIGLAAARKFKALGLNVVVADRAGLSELDDGIVTIETDVSQRASVEALARGPENEVTRSLDEKRSAWAAGDIIEDRPPLSRWHPDWAQELDAFVRASQ